MLRRNNNNDIFLTVLYGDIFDFPLTQEELQKYLIASTALHVTKKLPLLHKNILQRNGFYYLKGREHILKKRQIRSAASKRKIVFASKIARILAWIPSIYLIGLSGSVALENADEGDDIDFYIITAHGALWTTRLLVLLLVQFLGVRRRRNEKYPKDKICLNMFVDEHNLRVEKKHHNVYMAHEIIQMKPLVIKQNSYYRYLSENKWVSKFLPRAMPKDVQYTPREVSKTWVVLKMIEILAKKVQLWYMQNRKTRETITDSVLAFHPIDHEANILLEFKKHYESYAV